MPGPGYRSKKWKKKYGSPKKSGSSGGTTSSSSGGRTASEAALGRSMAAAGKRVSRTNRRRPRRTPSRPTSTAGVQSAVERQATTTTQQTGPKRPKPTTSGGVLPVASIGTDIGAMSGALANSLPKLAEKGFEQTGRPLYNLLFSGKPDKPELNALERRAGRRASRATRSRQNRQRRYNVAQANLRQQRASTLRPRNPFTGPTKQERRVIASAEALDKQARRERAARYRRERVIAAGQLQGVSQDNNRRPSRAPQTRGQLVKYINKTLPRFYGVAGGPNNRGINPRAGGRTPNEVRRALAAQGKDANVSRSNLTVARGLWRKDGNAPTPSEAIDALVKSVPQDRRRPTQKQLVQDEGALTNALVTYSRTQFDSALEEDLPIARPHRNPWVISDSQAPRNETPQQKAAREEQVLKRLMSRNPGFGLDTIDPYKQFEIRGEDSAAKKTLGIDAAERVATDWFVRYPRNLSNATSFTDFLRRVRDVPKSGVNMLALRQGTLGIDGPSTGDYEATLGDGANTAINAALLIGFKRTLGSGIKFGGRVRQRTRTPVAKNRRDPFIIKKENEKVKDIVDEVSDKPLSLPSAFIAEATQTRAGKLYLRTLDFLRKPAVRQTRLGAGYGVLAGATAESVYSGVATNEKGYALSALEATLTANLPDSTKTTARNLLLSITAPVAFAANSALTIRRGIGALGNDDPYYSSSKYVLNPVERLAEETWAELERMYDVYTSRDVDRIREATEDDYGYITAMSAFWLTRPATALALKFVGKRIAHSRAGQAVIKRWWEDTKGQELYNRQVKRRIDNFRQASTTVARTGVIQTGKDLRTQGTRGNVTTAVQFFNQSEPGRGRFGPEINNKLNRLNEAEAKAARDAGVDPPKPLDVLGLATALRSRGEGVETTREDILAELENVGEASLTYRQLSFIAENPRLLEDVRFAQILEQMDLADDIVDDMRDQSQPLEQRERDREVKEQELVNTYIQRTGDDSITRERPSSGVAREEVEGAERLEELRGTERPALDRRIRELAVEKGMAKADVDNLMAIELSQRREGARENVLERQRQTASERLLGMELRSTERKARLDEIDSEKRELYRAYRRLTGQSYKAGRDAGRAQARSAEESRRRAAGRGRLGTTSRELTRGKRGKRNQGRIREASSELETRLRALDQEEREIRDLDREQEKAIGELKSIEDQLAHLYRRRNPKHAAKLKKAQDELIAKQQELEKARTEDRPALESEISRLAERVEGQLTRAERLAIHMFLEDDPEVRQRTEDIEGLKEKEQEQTERVERLRNEHQMLSLVIGDVQSRRSLDELFADIEEQLDALDEPQALAQSMIGSPERHIEMIPANVLPKKVAATLITVMGRKMLAELDEKAHLLLERGQLLENLLADIPRRGSRKRLIQALERAAAEKSGQLAVARRNRRATRQELKTKVDVPSLRHAAFSMAVQMKRGRMRRDRLLALTEVWRQNISHILETQKDLSMPTGLRGVDADRDPDVPSGAPRDRGWGSQREQRREGILSAQGREERSSDQQMTTYEREIEAEGNRRTTDWVIGNATFAPEVDGKPKMTWYEDELPEANRLAREQNDAPLTETHVRMDIAFLSSENYKGMVEVIGRVPAIDRRKRGLSENDPVQKAYDEAQGLGDQPGTYQFKDIDPATELDRLTLGELAEKIDATERRAGRQYVFVNRDTLRILYEQTKEIKGIERFLYRANRISSRIVLGSSLSWAVAQPVAELAILGAQHPIKMWPRLLETHRIRSKKDSEWLKLATLARSTPGVDPVINQRDNPATMAREQRRYYQNMRWLKRTPGGTLVDELSKTPTQKYVGELYRLELLGSVDKWKGAWIREAGLLAELDSNLHGLRRASKAVKGQMDEIEKAADMLSNMTRKQQIDWLVSDEGIDVGMRLAQYIDDQLGNWTDLRPGFEQYMGQILFFYPFIRFSLNWALRTYPRDHPVVWTLANVMGIANAETLERVVNYDPLWPNEWAVAPIYGTVGEAADYDPDNPDEYAKPENQGPVPTSLLPINRFSWTGNILTEMPLNQTIEPNLTMAYKLMPPVLSMVVQGIAGQDAFGQKLQDADAPFGSDENASLLTRLGASLDSGINLFMPARVTNEALARNKVLSDEGRKYSLQGALDPSDGNTEWWNPIGEDPNNLRAGLRDAAIPGLPMPTSAVQSQNVVRRAEERLNKARDLANTPYKFDGKDTITVKGKDRDFNSFVEGFLRLDEANVDERGKRLPRTPQMRKWIKEYNRISRQNKRGSALEKKARLALYNAYLSQGVKLPNDDYIAKALSEDTASKRTSRKVDFVREFAAGVWPGPERAKMLLDEQEAGGGVVDDLKAGFAISTPREQNHRTTPHREQVTERLVNGTRGTLEEQGVKKADLSDPRIDPRTKVNKDGYVTNYRGAKVRGKQTLADLKKAERDMLLDVDTQGRITTPAIRDAIFAVNDFGNQFKEQQEKLTALKSKLTQGGVPSGVPEKYRASVRKWGAWLEKEMKKNGLVQPYETAIMDGYGVLPKGMSGAEYLAKILQAESGWDESIDTKENTSSAGAMGLGQFIPGTRASVLENYGVDAYADADQQIHAAAILLSKGGMENYNSLFPNSSHDPVGKGGYHYYYEQDVGKMIRNKPTGNKKQQQQQIAQLQSNVNSMKKQFQTVSKQAEELGIEVALPTKPTLWIQPKKPKGKPGIDWLNGTSPSDINPDIIGLARTISRTTGLDLDITSALRPEDYDSNHSHGGALDISAIADGGEGEKRGDAIAYAAVIAAGGSEEDAQALASGAVGYVGFVSPNGQPVEFLWKGDGDHRDHVHIAIESTGRGKKVFRGRKAVRGGALTGQFVGGGGSGSSSGGSGSAASAAGAGMSPEQAVDETIADIDQLRMGGEGVPYEDGGVDSAVTAIAEASASEGSEDGVKSVAEVMAQLPSVTSKKKKVPRFSPNNRI